MIACVITLALGLLACVAVLATLVRTLLDENRRLTAALAAPTRAAAVKTLTERKPVADPPEHEPVLSPLIGA